ncbi:hypothetical protein [Streptomyces sp. NPDC018045]|uniref:hypothetical protein n=1 Tax=Streptomyces sp. NPDC018045 TaxID=3365037 RepID=UPI003789111A
MTTGAAALLDGAGSWAERCVDLLGTAVLGRLTDRAVTVEACLSRATTEVLRTREGAVDARGGAPHRLGAAVVRAGDGTLEWLVFNGAVVMLDLPSGLEVCTHDSAAGREPAVGGPVSGRVELGTVRQAAVLSSGAARLVTFGVAVWEQMMDTLAKDGPQVLIDEVRAFEAIDPERRLWPRSGVTADATAVYLRF